MATQQEKVRKYFEENGSITSLEMFNNFFICCPQAVIRDLRKVIDVSDEWVIKKRKEVRNGKEYTKTIQFKRYFLDKGENYAN